MERTPSGGVDFPAVLRTVVDRTVAAHRAVFVDGNATDEQFEIVAAWGIAKLNAFRLGK